MNIKRSLSSVLVCLLYLFPAHADVRTMLQEASARDVQLLLNLTYWSAERSRSTLQVQNNALDHITQSWKLWQNCAQTRLNPTRLPYPTTTSVSSSLFNALAQQHMTNHSHYAQITELIIKQQGIKHKEMNAYILEMRSQARQQAAQAVWQSLADFYLIVQKAQQELINCAQALNPPKRELLEKNIITDGIQYLVGGLSLRSFAIFDRQFNKKNDQILYTLLKIQQLYNDVWEHIETIRVNFYTEQYNSLSTLARELNLPASVFTCIFTGHNLPQPLQ